uniref:Fibrous sheath-interacting protein 2 C-terminal domain-containing protein n=1 Tax=Salvator merianae TaxID=96440 RepID=A0A8D0E431_SALMN
MDQADSTVHHIAHLLIREILNFHLQPFVSDSNSFVSGDTKWKKEQHPFFRRIYSATLLEDIVVAFFCKTLSSPNMLTYYKEANLSDHKLRDLIIKLVDALVNELKRLHVKVVQCAEEEDFVCRQEKREPEMEPSAKNMAESILKEFAKSPVKVLQLPKGGQTFPAVSKTEVAKIIHASLCSILQDQGSGLPVSRDMNWDCKLAEKLASAIKKEILDYQIQEVSANACGEQASQSFDVGEMVEKVLMDVKEINSPPQATKPHPILVSQRFVHDVISAFMAKILPISTTDAKDECSEFDSIHMKLLNRVMAELSKNKDADIQYLDKVQPNRVVSQTVANSIYNRILPEFGTHSTLEKCIRTGCTILMERIVDLLRTHLKGLSTIIIEEVAVKLLSKTFHSLPLGYTGTRSVASMEQVARKLVNSLQELISENKLKVKQHDYTEDLGSEDNEAVGELVDFVYMDMVKHSSSETSLCKDLMDKNEDLVNKIVCFMVNEMSKHDFQTASGSEDEFPLPTPEVKLECDKIIKKFLENIAAGKSTEDLSLTQTSVLPVSFLEEILSRFLTNILLTHSELGILEKNSLSAMAVNEMASQLKMSVEKEMSKNKIGLVASDDQLTLDPQYEDTVNHIVQSVINNVLEKSGSQQELYNDMTKGKVIFPEQVASIIINEISTFARVQQTRALQMLLNYFSHESQSVWPLVKN